MNQLKIVLSKEQTETLISCIRPEIDRIISERKRKAKELPVKVKGVS